ncbi:MAG: hypothetical protein ACK45B_06895 [Limisphaerales bacterium]
MRFRCVTLALFCGWLGLLSLPAQQALRSSLASEQAAAARKKSLNLPYNLELDPVRLRFHASTSLEYNDNVNYRATNPEDDWILRPMLGVQAVWVMTERNSLEVALDCGYEHYFNGTRQSRPVVAGDQNSGLFFNLFVGDFAITLRDVFLMSQETSGDPSAGGVANVWRLENTLGATVAWDLRDIILQVNYDHKSYLPLDDQFKYLRYEADLASARSTFFLNPALAVGLDLGAGWTDYRDARLSDYSHYSLGPFVLYQVTDALEARLGAGQVYYDFEPSSFLTNATSQSSVYVDASLRQRLTPRTGHSLSLGQSLSADLNGTPVKMLYVRYAMTLNIIQYWSFAPTFSWEDGEQTRGVTSESFTRYTGGLTVGRQLGPKLSASVGWFFQIKQSDVSAFEYTQNRLVLGARYQF